MSVLNIFGSTPPPGVYTLYPDGNPSVILGQSFTTYGGKLPDAQCLGGRVYVPTIDAHPHTSKVTVKAWLGTDLSAAPVRSKEVAVPAIGWVDATFDTPFDMPADGSPVTIGYQFTGTEFGVTRYVHTPGLRGSSAAIQAAGDIGLELGAAPSTYLLLGGAQTTQPSNVGYGIDIIVEGNPVQPEPENVGPSVDTGSNRSMYVGQTTVLTAAGTDADGTIASYDWFQTGGPAATLVGSGAVRTFTPTTVGTYTFAATATDNDGATSAPNPVTVTVLAVPVEVDPIPQTPTAGVGVFEMIEVGVKDLIVASMPEAANLIGGDLSYDEGDDFYIFIGMVSGFTFETGGEWTLDIDVFDSTYGQAMRRCLALESILLKPGGWRTPKMRIDRVTQNQAPSERPNWDDDSSYRVGATYTFTARRPSPPKPAPVVDDI